MIPERRHNQEPRRSGAAKGGFGLPAIPGLYDAGRRDGLRGPILVSAIVHLLLFVAVSVLARSHIPVVRQFEQIPIDLVSMPAPEKATTERQPDVTAPPAEVVPDPLRPPPKPKPKPKPPEPKPPEKKPEAKPPEKPKVELPKKGAAEARPTVRTEMPAVGDESVSLRAEGRITEYSYYLGLIQRKISSFWEPPMGLERGGTEIASVVWFRIERDGSVATSYVEEPSGWGIFDTASLRALQRALPLPPLPQEFPDEYLIIHLRFVYRE